MAEIELDPKMDEYEFLERIAIIAESYPELRITINPVTGMVVLKTIKGDKEK